MWTDAGNKVGKLVNYCIDTTSGAVVAYLFTPNGWKGITNGTYILSPNGVITLGSQRIIVAEASIEDAQQYEEGLNKKIQHAKKFIHDDIVQGQEDFGVAVQNTQKAASGLKIKAHQAIEVAKEKLSDAAKKLQHRNKKASAEPENSLDKFEANSLEDRDSSEEIDRHLPFSDADSEIDTEETSFT